MNWKEIVGKTIKSVDEKFGANVVKLRFTDGTTAVVDTEAIGYGLYRPTLESTEGYKPEKKIKKITGSMDDKVSESMDVRDQEWANLR